MTQSGNVRWPLRAALLAAALIGAAAQAAPADLAGCYDGHAMEIAAGLELGADGRFRYGLSYGALDEEAQGRWESDGASVFLTSDPVTPPRFRLVEETAGAPDVFRVRLDLPQGMDPQYFDARLTLADGEVVDRQLGEDGLALALEPGMRVVSAQFRLPVFALASESFPLSAGNGREARFRFEPNDLGKVAFAHAPLRIEGRDLLLARHDRQLRFRKASGCE